MPSGKSDISGGWFRSLAYALDHRAMKRAFQLVTFAALWGVTAGCANCFALFTQRTWTLGVCRQSANGSYSCTVKVPKRLSGVDIYAKLESKSVDAGDPFDIGKLRFLVQNQESRMVEVAGLEWNVHLKPGETTVLQAKTGADGLGYICALDTSEAALRLTVEVLGGPEGATIRILGHTGAL